MTEIIILENPNLKCNGIAECPNCETVQYIQTVINDVALIRTCHKCEQSWSTPHEPEYLALVEEIEMWRRQ